MTPLLPCPRCGGTVLHYFEGNKHVCEYVSCACGIDFCGTPEQWNTRQTPEEWAARKRNKASKHQVLSGEYGHRLEEKP